jgi:hypothetical protein
MQIEIHSENSRVPSQVEEEFTRVLWRFDATYPAPL